VGWFAPAAQFWHVEIALLLALTIQTLRHADGRGRFEALLIFDLIMDAIKLFAVRTQHLGLFTNLSYFNYIVDVPLWALAMQEAADHKPKWHRTILFWWFAVSAGCAWIRFFPWTNRMLLVLNSVAYAAWIWKARRGRYSAFYM
jgi:hypothetical protein